MIPLHHLKLDKPVPHLGDAPIVPEFLWHTVEFGI